MQCLTREALGRSFCLYSYIFSVPRANDVLFLYWQKALASRYGQERALCFPNFQFRCEKQVSANCGWDYF